MMGMAGMSDNMRATRRLMAKGCYRALMFQVYFLFPLALLLVLSGDKQLPDVVQSVGVWAGGLNLALGAVIGVYNGQATKDDAHRREHLHNNNQDGGGSS